MTVIFYIISALLSGCIVQNEILIKHCDHQNRSGYFIIAALIAQGAHSILIGLTRQQIILTTIKNRGLMQQYVPYPSHLHQTR